jgi:L-aspartate oxidase
MWDNVGLARTREELEATRDRLNTWRPADVEHRLFPDWEDANLLILAKAVTAAALARMESRGGHYRLDHPASDPKQAKPIIISRKAH